METLQELYDAVKAALASGDIYVPRRKGGVLRDRLAAGETPRPTGGKLEFPPGADRWQISMIRQLNRYL